MALDMAVWTVGFEGQTPEALAKLLQQAKIQQVVDVRRLPLSRKKGFSKQGLAATLAAVEIAYTHKPELGLAPAVREAYRRTGDFAALTAWYEDHLARQGAALAGLLQMVGQGRVCLLCSEADHTICHRSLLAARLERAGIAAHHL